MRRDYIAAITSTKQPHAVIPDAAKRRSEIHKPGIGGRGKAGVVDSGTRFARRE
jgi:hypothetical protein